MTRLTVDVPDHVQSRLRARATENGHASLEQYLQALLQSEADVVAAPDDGGGDYGAPADLTVTSDDELEAKALDGLDSGPATELNAAEWASIRREVADRIAAKRGPSSK